MVIKIITLLLKNSYNFQTLHIQKTLFQYVYKNNLLIKLKNKFIGH